MRRSRNTETFAGAHPALRPSELGLQGANFPADAVGVFSRFAVLSSKKGLSF